ncbi:MAG TPA: methylmalonyl Co-A mutase-associated GTPase MeaB [Bacteroidales bacterium]|nr:methylmalonyl Co-A mutase-associated GTPase MeaB [Bacteroidales bacterium]
MEESKQKDRTLKIQSGVNQPPSINPFLASSARKKKHEYTVEEYVSGIRSGNRTILSQAITLVESSLQKHYTKAQEIVERCLPYTGNSLRIGITGVPGAGKSTFIETFGLHVTSLGRKMAVLAIDPSSEQTGGSILGDKTRMEQLSSHPSAFIRPSPASGSLGGVARKTRETIILCEAAGYDTILVETVGVGQSETEVHSMVDFFLLLMLAGAGDEIQGIKRGIMEMADMIAITKADGQNTLNAEGAKILYQNALHLFPPPPSGWRPRVVTCSAKKNIGITELWDIIIEYSDFARQTGYFEILRKQQAIIRMDNTIKEFLQSSFYNDASIKAARLEVEKQLSEGTITSYKAAYRLLDKYFKNEGH